MAWKAYNPNPSGRNVGDCAVRAVAKALDLSWDAAYVLIANAGYQLSDMPSSNAVWGSVLRRKGFERKSLPDSCPDCYTAGDFCEDHPTGLYVLGFGTHVATVENGMIYDSWDSSNEIPQYYWKKEC